MSLLKIKLAKSGSAIDQIAIKSVMDNVLILSNLNYRMVIETSSFNFELMSDTEQDVLIDNYQDFLNGLDSSIQILIRTKELDIDNYITELNLKLRQEHLLLFKDQLKDYQAFIKSLINVNHILSRNFYIVIPLNLENKSEFSLVLEQLKFKTDLVSKGLKKLGMQVRTLSSLEILNLFYSFYCPSSFKSQPISDLVMSKMNYVINSNKED